MITSHTKLNHPGYLPIHHPRINTFRRGSPQPVVQAKIAYPQHVRIDQVMIRSGGSHLRGYKEDLSDLCALQAELVEHNISKLIVF